MKTGLKTGPHLQDRLHRWSSPAGCLSSARRSTHSPISSRLVRGVRGVERMHSKGPRTCFDASGVVSRASLLLVARSLKSAICETRATLLPHVNRKCKFIQKQGSDATAANPRSVHLSSLASMLAQSYTTYKLPQNPHTGDINPISQRCSNRLWVAFLPQPPSTALGRGAVVTTCVA
jgi:hypothetical protein